MFAAGGMPHIEHLVLHSAHGCAKALDNEFCEAKLVLKTAQDVQFSNKLDAEANGAI